jgi:thiamine-phosphate diphosphorylase
MSKLPFDILVITDQAACAQVGKTVIEAIEPVLRSPSSHRVAVLVRDKLAPQSQVAEMLQILKPMAQVVGAKLLVHTHVNLALELGLNGVHMASGVELEQVKSHLLPNMLLGTSRHAQDSLDEADIGLADYATISPVYSPTSKPKDTRETLSIAIAGLESCVERSVRPLVALGGMRPGRVAGVMERGVGAIAISGAILQSEAPIGMLHQLMEEIDANVQSASRINKRHC